MPHCLDYGFGTLCGFGDVGVAALGGAGGLIGAGWGLWWVCVVGHVTLGLWVVWPGFVFLPICFVLVPVECVEPLQCH